MAWGTGSPMPDGVRADEGDGSALEVTPVEHRLLRGVRINLSLWSGGITLLVLVVLGVVLFFAVERSLAASGTAQLVARADQITRQRPDRDSELQQTGINFGGVGAGTLLVLATQEGQPIVLPGPNQGLPPAGLPLAAGIDAVKAGVERDIRTASITATDGTDTIETPIRVLTQGATLQGQPIFFQVVGDRTTEVRTLSVLVIVLIVGGIIALVVAVARRRRVRQPCPRADPAIRWSPSVWPCAASASSRPTRRTSCAPPSPSSGPALMISNVIATNRSGTWARRSPTSSTRWTT